MLADIVGSLRKGDANYHKFFRYRDDVVGRRLGIVCISGADRIKILRRSRIRRTEFEVDRLLEYFGVIDDPDEAQGRNYVCESQFSFM
jgi:hypothetical protein